MVAVAVVGSLWVLWIFYLAVMSLYRAHHARTLSLPAKLLGYPTLAVGALLDAAVNIIIMSVVFVERPYEWLVTKRLSRHIKTGGGWRRKLAAAIEHPMREVINVILAADLDPDHEDLTQLTQAIMTLIAESATTVADASTTEKGIVELATDAETQAGTDTVRAITPANLSSRTATETRAGIIELATAAETQAGTDTVRAITPANLSSRTATEARTGLVEKATVAEAQAFTAEKYIDAALLNSALKGANQLLNANGYQKLPGGLKLQWGFRSAASGTVSVTFPIAFSSACYSVTATRATGGADIWPPQIQSISTTGFTYIQSGNTTANMPVYWMAIGL